MNLDRVIAVRNDKTVYRDGNRCIKVFNAQYTKADVLSEALNQARIEETGLPIPCVLEATVVDGRWAIVSEYIQGKTLSRLSKENPDKANEYIEFMVDLQISINKKSCLGLGRLRDKMITKIAQTDLSATTRYDLHARLERMPRGAGICHGDINPSNIMLTEDGKAYILDWSHATQGNLCADAARTYLFYLLSGDESSAAAYLSIFCQKSGEAESAVRDWIPMVAAALSITCHEQDRDTLLRLAEGNAL